MLFSSSRGVHTAKYSDCSFDCFFTVITIIITRRLLQAIKMLSNLARSCLSLKLKMQLASIVFVLLSTSLKKSTFPVIKVQPPKVRIYSV